MWIRSQNKCVLVKSDCFSLETEYDVSNNDSITEIFANRKPVGTYSTIEKALNVLDDIQTHLKFERRFISNAGGGDYWLDKGAQVYQMPQDEDVKV